MLLGIRLHPKKSDSDTPIFRTRKTLSGCNYLDPLGCLYLQYMQAFLTTRYARVSMRKWVTRHTHKTSQSSSMITACQLNSIWKRFLTCRTCLASCGFVTYDSFEAAEAAIRDMDDVLVENCRLKVSLARKQPMLRSVIPITDWAGLGELKDGAFEGCVRTWHSCLQGGSRETIAPPKAYESYFIHHDFIQFGKQHSRLEVIVPSIVLSQQCCKVYFISLTVVNQ